MPRYMIELSHSPDKCIEALEDADPRAEDLLDEVFWGCTTGDHTARVVVEAENESAARDMVPDYLRDETTITEVDIIASELVESFDPEAVRPEAQDPTAS